jgi:hypothetical protein
MQYVHILALIDAELERLKEVRLLLTTLDAPPKGSQKRTPIPPVRSKTLRMAERRKPTAPALQIDKREVSQPQKTTPATRLKKPAVSDSGAARLAKVPPPAASESALVLDDKIRQGRAPMVEEGALSQMAPIASVVRVRTHRKRRALSKLSVMPLATPLGGPVPTEPIFIPAELIRQKQSRSRQESVTERGAGGPPAAVPLTAELLTQRWIQGSVALTGLGETRSSRQSRH